MSQRSSFSRTKEPKSEKVIRNRRDEEERNRGDEPLPRRSFERSLTSSYSRFKENSYSEKPRARTRDGQGNLVFRRQEGGKFSSRFNKGSTPETSPGRLSQSDSVRNDIRTKYDSTSHYRSANVREREYTPKRSNHTGNRIYDDYRLTSLLTRLQRDEDKDRQACMIRQLNSIFSQMDNPKTLVSHLDEITETYDRLILFGFSEYKTEIISSLSVLAAVLGNNAKRLLEWEFRVYADSKSDDVRLLILKILHKTLKNDRKLERNLADLMPYIMSNLQSALEIADIPDLLVAIVDAIFEVSSAYPDVFANHFSNTVDILIGWHIDATQQPSVTQYTSKALISFQQFWIRDIKFTITLLGQFLEDMESYADGLPKIKKQAKKSNVRLKELPKSSSGNLETPSTVAENIAKIRSLIRVLTTVLKSIENASLDENGPISCSFSIEMLRNFLTYVKMTTEYCYFYDLMTTANECVCLLLKQSQSRSLDALDLLMEYINILQAREISFLSELHISSILSVMLSFVKVVGSHLPVEFVSNLFSETSLSRQLRFSPSSKVQEQLLSLQHAVLSVKNVHVVEKLYNCITSDMEIAFSVLIGGTKDNEEESDQEKAQISLLSCLSVLVEIGNAKHSFIRMWALIPNFFELMTETVKPASADLATKYPAVQYAILFTLYSHSQRHNHFISSSSLLNQKISPLSSTSPSGHSSPILTNVLPSPPNSGNLVRILVLLVDLLKQKETSYDSRLLAITWASEIVEDVQQNLIRIIHESNFSELIQVIVNTAFINDPAICEICCSILQTLLKNVGTMLSETVLQSCYEACILKLSVHNVEIQDMFASLLVLLPLDVVISGFPANALKPSSFHTTHKDSDSLHKSYFTCSDVWLARHGHMIRPCMGNFHGHNFRTIAAFILQGMQPQNKDWLLNLFNCCPPPDRPGRSDKLLSRLAAHSSTVLWFWATWEMAQTCVMSKLRTPLGKPQETFMAIEAAIKSCAELYGKQETQLFCDDQENGLLRVHLLLSLMEHLEKLMYNAYEGCAGALPFPPKTVRTFFRTNKATCLEWLARVRQATMIVALKAGQPAVALRHGFELLHEMKNTGKTQGSKFENILFYVVKALIDLRCSEAVLGLYLWCKDRIGRKFIWIKVAADHAAGRFEAAAHEYACVLHSLSNSPSPMKTQKNIEELTKHGEKLKNGTSVNLGLSSNSSEDVMNMFNHLSVKDVVNEQDPTLPSFLINQATECYVNLGCWSDVSKWVNAQEKLKFSQNGMSVPNIFNDDISYLSALTVFEDGLKTFSSNKTSLDFSGVNLKSISSLPAVSSWDSRKQIHYVQRLLMSSAVEYENKIKPTSEELEVILKDLEEAKSRTLQLMKVSALNWPPHLDPLQASMFVSASALSSVFETEKKASNILLHDNVKLDPPDYCSSILAATLGWQSVWLHMATKEQGGRPHINSLVDLLLVTARLARKQQNLKMSQKLLLKNSSYLLENGLGSPQNPPLSPVHLLEAANLRKILKKSLDLIPSEKLVKLQREGAKLLHSTGDTDGAYEILLLCSVAVSSKLNEELRFDLLNNKNTTSTLNELNSRSLLSLVKYLLQDSFKGISELLVDSSQDSSFSKVNNHSTILFDTVNEMEKMDRKMPSCSVKSFLKGADLQRENIVGDAEFLVGRLLQLSVHQCPSLAKAWCAFASWCYRWGKKVVDTASNHCMNLLPAEKNRILSMTPKASKDEIDAVIKVITSLHGTSGGEWDNQEMDYTENGAEETRQQLLVSCPFLLKVDKSEEVVEQLVDIWKTIVSRTYYYYKMAAQAYLQYLQLNGQSSIKDRSEDDNVTATLRLLRLVVKHASELRDVLEDGLAQTPTAPWRGIIPQLFSRLNHPEPYVRQSISDLLCRVGQASPHLIVFPAVVGSLTLKAGPQLPEATSRILGAYFSETIEDPGNIDLENTTSQALDEELPPSISNILSVEEESEDDHQKTAIMQNCFAALVETLGRQDGRTISEVKNLVHELHRITLLWDELWLGTLNLHHSEASRRISNLEKEISKVMNNSYLSKEEKREIIREKHNVFIQPTLFVLEQLQMITSQPAETPHEQWFQKTFEKHIDHTLNKLKNPPDPSQPQESWVVYKQLHQLLQQRVQQQSRSHMSMDYISPILASLKSTVIPMPGINKKVSSIITIQSVNEGVSILPTKTKPKKLAFIGSDGHKYTYLFKGLEDLHLDERIMQFLSIVNNMFAKNKRNSREVYNARHYSVTPLGPRSGLIQWVDGATPLFGLYKRWQQREATAATIKGQNSSTTNIGTSAILRPSEIYYNKLTPLLKDKGLSSMENRKEWPLSIQLDVLKELMEETPNDLLAKELWCSCSSPLEWWNVTQTYNHSTAVMSMIGYIIGLGDRHLDNVLVDLATGEVVHIDYNVCFEKGKNLRVPEKVPFRLTPNIETALGVTGVEGIFRVSCEHVLKVLRKGRETLLTLLEAFVYDPLVDWTPGNEGGYTGAVYGGRQVWAMDAKHTRQNMEMDIALSMFSIRVAEMKGEWLKNRDDLLSALPKLETLLEEWESAQLQLQVTESQLQEACLEKALLEEAQANSNHHLYTLPKRYEETTAVNKTVKVAQDAVREKLAKCKKWHTLHCNALSTVCGSELAKWCGEVSNDSVTDSMSIVPVVEFLQAAGQGQLVQQCEHSETELGNVLQQQRLTVRSCIELLTTYATIVMQYGPAFKERSRSFRWQEWLESLLNEFSVAKCQEVVAKFHNYYGIESMDVISVQSAVTLQYQLVQAVTEANSKLFALSEKQRIEGLTDKMALSTFFEEARHSLLRFIAENSQQSHLSLLCIIVNALCGMQKRLLMMETAAAAAGDHLINLTSWGGDWFLDEICSMCANITEFMRLLQDSFQVKNLNPELKAAINGVHLAYCIFNALEDLSLNFQNIILPEAIQTAQEPTVIEMAAKLDRIIARCGVPLERLITELETNIRNIILENQISETWVNDTVKKLKNEFESLMKKTEPQISDLNQGQMLLMGFNGLFTKVDSDLEMLLVFLDSQQLPSVWKKLDCFRDTVALTPSVHLSSTRTILKDIYFLRKLLAMQQFFHVCHELSATLQCCGKQVKSSRDSLLVTDHQLLNPVKLFTADYVRQMVLGLPSQAAGFAICLLTSHLGFNLTAEIELRDVGVESKVSIDEIGKKAVDLCVSENFLQSHLSPVSSLVSSFDAAMRKEDIARRLEQHMIVSRGSLQRVQLQLASFQWLNEDLLSQGNTTSPPNSIPTRATVMSEMRKTVQALLQLDSAVAVSQERFLGPTGSIEQRLKWGTGANPSLATVQEEFEAAVNVKTVAVANANHLSRELVNVCNAILHFEALRTRTNEAMSSDSAFMNLIGRCQESCILAESCNSQVSTAEEHLIELKPLSDKEGVTPDWISSVMEKVSRSLTSCREKLDQKKSFTFMCWDALNNQVAHLHDLISMHHKLMSEVRPILRNLAKHEEQQLDEELKSEGRVHSYVTLFKEVSEEILCIVNKLLAEGQDIEITHLNEIKSQIPPISAAVSEVYMQLLELAGPLGNKKYGVASAETSKPKKCDVNKKHSLISQSLELSGIVSPMRDSVLPRTPLRGATPKKLSVTRDPRTGKAIQERNTYATSVWKRVKMKLDGRDPDPSKKSTIPEQVDFVIKEATNMENLAVLYEGWTPWV